MSLLLSEGHSNAGKYPIGELWSEARRARQRVNRKIAVETLGIHAAIVSVLSGDVDHLNGYIKEMNDGD